MKSATRSPARLFCFIAVIIFCISLIPILIAGAYNKPISDDYSYSANVHDAITQNKGFFEVIRSAADTTAGTYYSWQGTFAAVFIFALQPGAISQNLYGLTVFILCGSLIGSQLFLAYSILKKWLNISDEYVILITVMTCFMEIQFLPNLRESLFWFNGGSYYTLFYSFACLYSAILIRIIMCKKMKPSLLICGVLLAIIIGGGNYTTALFCCELSFLAFFMMIIKKNRAYVPLGIIFLALFSSFMISVTAPGNLVRAETVNGIPAARAVFFSLLYGMKLCRDWTTLWIIVYLIACFPIVWRIAGKCKWSFRYPLSVCFLAFCMFASQLTPPVFAMGHIGYPRQIDIYYYSYFLLLLFVHFYLFGWIQRNYPLLFNSEVFLNIIRERSFMWVAVICCVFFVSISSVYKSTSSVMTTRAIFNGEIQQYNEQYKQIITVLENSRGESVVINDVTVCPAFYSYLFISEDENFWVNKAMEGYFHLESIARSP